jgi:hypothetical protein
VIFETKIRGNILKFASDKYDHYILEKVLDVGKSSYFAILTKGPLGHKQWIFEIIYEYREQFCVDQFASKVF